MSLDTNWVRRFCDAFNAIVIDPCFSVVRSQRLLDTTRNDVFFFGGNLKPVQKNNRKMEDDFKDFQEDDKVEQKPAFDPESADFENLLKTYYRNF
jgi:hypothetical protein